MEYVVRTIRDAAYLLVAVGSLGVAVYQPFDANTEQAAALAIPSASPAIRPVAAESVETTVDRAVRFSPGLKI